MAQILTDLALRLYAQTSELKSGLKEAGNSASKFKNTAKGTGKEVNKSFASMSKGAGSALSQMTGGMGAIGPAASGAVGGFKAMAMGATALNVALGPIGLIIGVIALALKALMSYFTGTVDGAKKLASIMGFLKGVMAAISDAFIKAGRWMVEAFQGVSKWIKEVIGNVDGLKNRWEGFVGIFVNYAKAIMSGAKGIGLAIKGIFDSEAKAKSKEHFAQMKEDMTNVAKATAQLVTGNKYLADSVKKVGDEESALMQKIKALQKLEEDRFTLMRRNMQLAKDESDSRRVMAGLLLKTRDYQKATNDERQKALVELEKREKAIADASVSAAQEKVRIQTEQNRLTETSIEDEQALIDAQVELNNAYITRDNKLREIINRQNEYGTSVQKYIDAEIKGWENMSKVQAEAAVKAKKERLAKEKETLDAANALREGAEQSWVDYQKAENEKTTQGRLDNLKAEYDAGLILVQEYEASKAAIEDEAREAKAQKEAEALALDHENKMNELNSYAEGSISVMDSISSMYESAKKRELDAAGNNAKKKAEIEKKYAKKQQNIAYTQAVIGTALAVVNALQTQPFIPMGLIAAVAAGAAGAAQIAAISSASFADGGLVYGPTMGLVGEYPGAKNNPEVIAPLDKLQNMLSGNGGVAKFILEGDQLVALVDHNRQLSEAF